MKVDERLLVLHVPQHRRGRLPAPLLRLGARADAHSLAEFGVHQLLGAGGVSVDVAGFDEEAGVVVADEVGDASRGASHYGDAAGHAFEDDESECFGITGHHKRIRASECAAQLVPRQLSRKHRIRPLKILLQLLLVRPRTHKAQPRLIAQPLQHRLNILQPLLASQPPHVHHEKLIGISIRHCAPHLLRLKLGIEPHGVDSLPPNVHAGYAVLLHLRLHLRTRDQGEIGAGVHPSQQRPRQFLAHWHPLSVLPRVQREVSMVAQEQWDAHDPRVEESREEEKSGRGDVYQIGTSAFHHFGALHFR
mmetsp:Transcript_12054/g.21748  ORF Transcript_12054/g.21748 Transcript_12054/m.21748 type:complete len:306 (+) Transcript_12054:1371-2288(+)